MVHPRHEEIKEIFQNIVSQSYRLLELLLEKPIDTTAIKLDPVESESDSTQEGPAPYPDVKFTKVESFIPKPNSRVYKSYAFPNSGDRIRFQGKMYVVKSTNPPNFNAQAEGASGRPCEFRWVRLS